MITYDYPTSNNPSTILHTLVNSSFRVTNFHLAPPQLGAEHVGRAHLAFPRRNLLGSFEIVWERLAPSETTGNLGSRSQFFPDLIRSGEFLKTFFKSGRESE